MKGRKGAIKGLIVFVAVMVLITFFSGTVYYGTLPKVAVGYPSGGALVYEYYGASFVLESDGGVQVALDVYMPQYPMRVKRVCVSQFDEVAQGDILISFEPAVGEYALDMAGRDVQRIREELDGWDGEYLDEFERIDSDIEETRRAMNGPDADVSGLSQKIADLRQERTALESARTVNGVSRLSIEQRLSDAQAVYDQLLALNADGWNLTANADGIVGGVYLAAGDDYSGLLAAADIIPGDAEIRVGVETRVSEDDLKLETVTVYTGAAMPRNRKTGWTYAGATHSGEMTKLWATPDEGVAAFNGLSGLTFRFETERYQHLVPNGAVAGDSVYVLDTRSGAFGNTETYARRVEVRNCPSDGENTAVLNGLSGMDQVIVIWDRPFAEGDAVVVPYD